MDSPPHTQTTDPDGAAPPSSPAPEEREEREVRETLRSYTPSEAYGGWQPARVFNHTQCKLARQQARAHHLAMFSAEISETSRAMNYIVGPWDTAIDMVVRRELLERGQASLLMCKNPDALGAVYECVYKDQRCQGLFDLEFYADAKHGNAHLEAMDAMDTMTRTVAHMASLLMAELFPDQVTVAPPSPPSGETPTIVRVERRGGDETYAPPGDEPVERWPARALVQKHYEPPRGSSIPSVTIDPERHWAVLDASKGAKRSQHLVLDGNLCGVCWDTLLDQAIFVGLLLRRIYTAAFLSEGDDTTTTTTTDTANTDAGGLGGFVRAARGLFVTDLHGDTEKVWMPMVDPVVYKTFQLIRTGFSSKRTQHRPLLPRTRRVFPQAPPEGPKSHELLRTLVGRVPQGRTVQRLSFSGCYPGMFPGVDWTEYGAGVALPPSCALPLGAWKWIPNYQSRGDMAPPRLHHTRANQGPEGPWSVERHRRDVHRWLAHIDPTVDPPTLFENAGQLAVRMGRLPTPSQHVLDSWNISMEYDASGREAATAAECVAHFIAGSVQLQPWTKSVGGLSQLASAMHIKVTAKRPLNPVYPIFYSALVCTNSRYCPIQRAEHQGQSPFLLINGSSGVAMVKCLAEKCAKLSLRLPVCFLPEQLEVIFPHAKRGAATEAVPRTPPSATPGSSTSHRPAPLAGAPQRRGREPATKRRKKLISRRPA